MSAMPGMTMTPNGMRSTSGSSQTNAMQAMLKPGAAPEAEAVAQAFQAALKHGDRAKALALLAPDARISEGGETQSTKEYASHHLGEDIAFLKDAQIKLISRVSMLMSDTAMVGTESDIQATIKGKSTTLRSREMLNLRKDGASWKIVSIQWQTTPVSGE
jgi:ketosteroid isomerase-like protein